MGPDAAVEEEEGSVLHLGWAMRILQPGSSV